MKYLENKKARLAEKKEALKARGLSSTSVEELRSINDQVAEIESEIRDIDADLAAIEEQERNAVPQNAELRNAQITGNKDGEGSDMFESKEYRKAFMAYIQRGEKIPAKFIEAMPKRAATNTNDVAPIIPLTIMRQIINTYRKRYGNLYTKARKISVQGGVEFPIGSLHASWKWINESTVSPRQKLDALGRVSFGYYPIELRLAQSFLSSIVSLDIFEATFAEVLVKAYLEAMDYAILSGTGKGMPLGILNDARVTNNVTFTEAQFGNWAEWRKRFFASLPLGYRDGEFIFTSATVDAYLETMADSNNNPIFRQATGLEVNDGDAQFPNGRFFGREIALVENDLGIADFGTASSSDVVGIFWQPEEYAINEQYGMSAFRYLDQETNEWMTKGIAIADGKVLNPNGIVLIKKA